MDQRLSHLRVPKGKSGRQPAKTRQRRRLRSPTLKLSWTEKARNKPQFRILSQEKAVIKPIAATLPHICHEKNTFIINTLQLPVAEWRQKSQKTTISDELRPSVILARLIPLNKEMIVDYKFYLFNH